MIGFHGCCGLIRIPACFWCVGMGTGGGRVALDGGGRRRRKLDEEDDEEYVADDDEEEDEDEDEEEYQQAAAPSDDGEEGGDDEAEPEDESDADFVGDEEEEEEDLEDEDDLEEVKAPRPKRPPKGKPPPRSRRRRQEDDDDDYEEEEEEDADFDPDVDEDDEEEVDEDEEEFEQDDDDSDDFAPIRARKTSTKNHVAKRKPPPGRKKKKRKPSRVSKAKPKKPTSGRRRRKRWATDDDEEEEDDADFIVEDDQEEEDDHRPKKKAKAARKTRDVTPEPDVEASAWPAVESDTSEFEFVTSDEEAADKEAPAAEPAKTKGKKGRKRWGSGSESSSDSDYVISEQELKDLEVSMPPDAALQSPATLPRRTFLSRRVGEKGKEPEEAWKQTCGICLSEEQRATIQGVLNCCAHYFCFACIMEWSKVESRCPLCKRRFTTITKSSMADLGLGSRKAIIRVEKRDQVMASLSYCYLFSFARIIAIEFNICNVSKPLSVVWHLHGNSSICQCPLTSYCKRHDYLTPCEIPCGCMLLHLAVIFSSKCSSFYL